MSNFQSLPGFREFYPEDCAARNHLFRAWREAARRGGFVEYDAPVLEPLELYLEKSGEEIRSQLFEFEDKGGRKVALRPEMTPSLARLVAAKAGSLRRPLKWFSIGECFRYEKPQKGRGRQFYQFNADILGESGPAADAECIALLVDTLRGCGLKEGEFEVRISDRKLWFIMLALFEVTEDQAVEVLAIVDKWERSSKEETIKKLEKHFSPTRAPQMYENINAFLNTPIEKYTDAETIKMFSGSDIVLLEKLQSRTAEIEELKARLNAFGLKNFYRFDLRIVRGLAYYTGFVFEAYQTIGTARALAGGGRYDNLIQKLGGPDLPAVGFAIGDMTVGDLLAELERPLGGVETPDVYLVLGEGADIRQTALGVVATLRAAGLSVDYPLKETGFGKQFKAANQCGAKLALILGPDEVAAGQVKIKDMKTSEEAAVPLDSHLAARVREKLFSA
jgi:histidyl-tRNA synthetase